MRGMPGMFEDMACRPVPVTEVVTGSTPVVVFGDPRNASVATLGINPSWHEFLADDGSLLSGSERRLATLTSLNAKDTALLDLDQARTVFEDCAAYFQPDRNPYRRWFDPLDQVLRAAFGVSYYAGTACHLDLVQWTTTPVWSELPRLTKGVLVREGLPYLRQILSLGNIRIVLLNGRQVIEQIKASRLFELEVCSNLAVNARRTCWLYRGVRGSVNCIGWSSNLQSSWGIRVSFRARLSAMLPNVRRHATSQAGEPRVLSTREPVDGVGRLIKGTRVENKREFLDVLQAWLIASNASAIGTGRGQQPWVFIGLAGGRTAVLNADTKRGAVEEYVRDAQARGADALWHILPNRRNGKLNKLSFRADGRPTPGWYCYLTEPASSRREA